MYKKIINPKTGIKVNINGQVGKSILQNYINYLNGGMPLPMIYIELRDKVNDKDHEIFNWLVKERHEKKRGIVTLILNKLKDEKDIIVKNKIILLTHNTEKIKSIIKESITDSDKAEKILKILDESVSNEEAEIIQEKCKICDEYGCIRGIRCGRTYNFEEDHVGI